MFDRKSRRERCSAGINGYGTAERGLGKPEWKAVRVKEEQVG